MMNNLKPTKKFSKLLKQKEKEGSLKKLVANVENAMELFRQSSNPESLGEKKAGEIEGLYSYKLNQSSRILYGVERRENRIDVILYRVCNHKQVYGTD